MQIIYALIDPRDKFEFYIGRTDDLFRRFKEHLSCVGTNEEKNARIRELQSLYLVPIMATVELVENDGFAGRREAYWIRHYLSMGRKLLNIQIEMPFTFDEFSDIMKGFAVKSEEPEVVEVAPTELLPMDQFQYHIVKGVRRKRTYVSFEEASQITGYTVSELKILAKKNKIKISYDREKLILASLKVKPYFGTNILNRKKW
jgi:predicted GIY-YIG superfamily endonuclease